MRPERLAVGVPGGFRRTSLTKADPEEAHDHIRAAYADRTERPTGSPERFRFRHDLAGAGG